jgi:hypothetical protein
MFLVSVTVQPVISSYIFYKIERFGALRDYHVLLVFSTSQRILIVRLNNVYQQ